MATRLIAAVLFLGLLNACATAHTVRLDMGQGTPLEYRPPSSSKPVKMGAEAFENALAQWVRTEPEMLLFPDAHPCQRVLLIDPRTYYRFNLSDYTAVAQHPVL